MDNITFHYKRNAVNLTSIVILTLLWLLGGGLILFVGTRPFANKIFVLPGIIVIAGLLIWFFVVIYPAALILRCQNTTAGQIEFFDQYAVLTCKGKSLSLYKRSWTEANLLPCPRVQSVSSTDHILARWEPDILKYRITAGRDKLVLCAAWRDAYRSTSFMGRLRRQYSPTTLTQAMDALQQFIES